MGTPRHFALVRLGPAGLILKIKGRQLYRDWGFWFRIYNEISYLKLRSGRK